MPTKFTIITAVYNNAEHIQHCIDSLNSQSYKDFEHIIIDGKSKDGTLEILDSNKDKFVEMVVEPDNGVCDAWNKGLKLATGDVIGFLHSDDFYSSNFCLEKIADAFNADPELDAVYTDLEYVSKNNILNTKRIWKSQNFKKYLIKLGWMPPHPTLYVKRNHYLSKNFFDTNFKIAGDYLSILRMFTKNKFKSKYLPFTSIKMRLGGLSNSFFNLQKKSFEDFKALRILKFNTLFCFFIVAMKNIQKITQIKFL